MQCLGKKRKKSVPIRNCQTFLLCIFQILLQADTCIRLNLENLGVGGGIVSIYLKGDMIPSTKNCIPKGAVNLLKAFTFV